MYLGARLLGVLGGDEDPGPEPLPGGEEGHDQHLGRHDPRVEGVRLEQLLVHLHAHGVWDDGKLCVQGLSVCNCPSLLLLAATATCFIVSSLQRAPAVPWPRWALSLEGREYGFCGGLLSTGTTLITLGQCTSGHLWAPTINVNTQNK